MVQIKFQENWGKLRYRDAICFSAAVCGLHGLQSTESSGLA